MEFLDKFVIALSMPNLELAKYLLCIASTVFLIYSGTTLLGTVLSLIYQMLGKKDSSDFSLIISSEYINIAGGSSMSAFGLGVVPYLSSIIFYMQTLQKSGSNIPVNLIVAFFLFIIAMTFILLYKNGIYIRSAYSPVIKRNADEQTRTIIKKGNTYFGIIGAAFLLITFWEFIACVSTSLDTTTWKNADSFFAVLFSLPTILRLIQFLTISASVFSGLYLSLKYKSETKSYEDVKLSKSYRFNARLCIRMLFLQPFLIFLNLLATPHNALSTSVYTLSSISFFLVLLAIVLYYRFLKDFNYKSINYSFVFLFAIFAIFLIKEQTSFGIANRAQTVILAKNFEIQEAAILEKESKAQAGVTVNGEDIYQTKCTACHAFDTRLVGPPHHDVIIKYKDNHQAMINFILNPVKVDPNYPQMPNQGLNRKEAEAVVEYMYKHWASQLK